MPALSNSAVVVESLVVHRGKRTAIDGVALTVDRGVITGLLGPSGCGKTTLLRSIVGTQIVTSGSVTVLGSRAGSKGLRSRIGYVTQAPSVYRNLTVRDNVAYFAAMYGKNKSAAASAIESVGLTEHAASFVGRLSGGQLTRVSLASALVAEPDLLVLDEPTVGLDPILRVELWNRFEELAAAGTTLLVSSHAMEEAEHCNSLILMREGSVVAQLSPDELRSSTNQSNLKQAFLSLIRANENLETAS